MDNEQLMRAHDESAQEACIWRRLQGLLAEQRDALLAAAPDQLAAGAAFERMMIRLCVEEGAAQGRMLRAREQLGRRPPRRAAEATSA